jgi:biotin carboxylase
MLTVGITSSGSGVGSAVLRSLALADLDTRTVCLDVAADAPGPHRGHRGRLVPRALDPDYPAAILETCAQEGIQALIPGLDTELVPLAGIAEDLRAGGCELIASALAVARLLRNKLACSDYFAALGRPFVATVPLARVEEILDRHGFPMVVKPLGGSGSRGVRVAFSRADLDALAEVRGAEPDLPWIVQPFLVPAAWGKRRDQVRPWDVYSEFSLNQNDEFMVQVVADGDGSPLGAMASRNVLKDGAIARMRPCQDDPAGATARALAMANDLAGLGLRGPCNFQGRVTADGPVFYEINPRFAGGSGGRALLGFNEVEACLRRLALGQSRERAAACLRPRYDQVCAWYPAEVLMAVQAIQQLDQGRTIRRPAG